MFVGEDAHHVAFAYSKFLKGSPETSTSFIDSPPVTADISINEGSFVAVAVGRSPNIIAQ
ncbi:hypothetical protein CP97_14861 [Aurantiacibacter atlanticus]|uniref:Uncharacterized protein n=1 Tax=Aurantiacibacter atlanticus TaxID=1648404 RepID=A0A168M3P2_9SPHN|nr:hypothetical protein CP97_14861 [Aurantiacibacter atlanticus]